MRGRGTSSPLRSYGARASAMSSCTMRSSTVVTHCSCFAGPAFLPFAPRPALTPVSGTKSGPKPPSSLESLAKSISAICLYLNGRHVSSGTGIVRHMGAPSGTSKSALTSKIITCFCLASPSISDVTTLLPSWDTMKSPYSVGSTRHSCSCPHTTRSSHEGRYLSLIAFFGEWCTRFWWMSMVLNQLLEENPGLSSGLAHSTLPLSENIWCSLASRMYPRP
mmetsp:Transcript_1574/g.7000  ORF Transcript_1574/g.7000 Transcript_1574/m.7000 type:complete len:221 (-) Transcript_1574:554-1216(-)